jgi:outer membrane receptor protein involved in Fe transport
VHSRTGDTSLFIQNTWQVRSNLTLNYGLRWEYFWPVWIEDQQNWQAVINSSQLSPAGVGQIVNKQAQDRFWGRRWSNFGPRFGISWDPTKTGRMSVRGGFGLLYDEINTYIATNGIDQNPPALAFLDASVQLGIPIVYGLAPEGTYDFPKNPNLLIPKLTPAGGDRGRTSPSRGRPCGVIPKITNHRSQI